MRLAVLEQERAAARQLVGREAEALVVRRQQLDHPPREVQDYHRRQAVLWAAMEVGRQVCPGYKASGQRAAYSMKQILSLFLRARGSDNQEEACSYWMHVRDEFNRVVAKMVRH